MLFYSLTIITGQTNIFFIFKYQDPDPYSEYRSGFGSRRPSNRNPKHWVTGTVSKKMKSLWLVENNNDLMMEFYADK